MVVAEEYRRSPEDRPETIARPEGIIIASKTDGATSIGRTVNYCLGSDSPIKRLGTNVLFCAIAFFRFVWSLLRGYSSCGVAVVRCTVLGLGAGDAPGTAKAMPTTGAASTLVLSRVPCVLPVFVYSAR